MTIETLSSIVRADHVLGPPQGRWTYADYADLPDDGTRYEIIDGVLYMAPAPSTDHENTAARSMARLVAAVEDAGLGRVFASPDIDLGTMVVRPDAVVVLNANLGIVEDKRLVGAPDLVVEITSPGTAAYDRDADIGKRGAYARAGVPEYWLADPISRTVEVLVLEDDAYVTLGIAHGDSVVPSRVLPSTTILARSCFPR